MGPAVWFSLRPRRGSTSRIAVFCAVVVATLGLCRQAPAAFFRYSTTVDVGTIVPTPNNVNVIDVDEIEIETDGGTFVDLEGFSIPGTDNLNADTIGTDILFGLIDVHVLVGSPEENLSIPFTFHVTIDDYLTDSGGVSQGTGTFDISGTVSGTIGAGLKVNLNMITIDTIAPMMIGNNLYTLSFNQNHYAPPGPFFAGRIGAHVVVPEPAALTLFTLGSLALATPAVRRWRGSRVGRGSR